MEQPIQEVHPMSTSPTERRGLYKAFAAGLSGTSLEWYDFAVYSSAAALVFGDVFFPGSDPLTGTLQAFATYAVGYVARPLGGIFFGRLGDVIGRKRVLVATLLLIGIATFCIGLLPTHAQAGAIAPTLLVALRFAQGVGVGGEWGGAVLLSSEFSAVGQRGFWASAARARRTGGNTCGQPCMRMEPVVPRWLRMAFSAAAGSPAFRPSTMAWCSARTS
jgi:MFS family permease